MKWFLRGLREKFWRSAGTFQKTGGISQPVLSLAMTLNE
jgi:hypothetical protein